MLLAFGIDDDAYDAYEVLGTTLAKTGTGMGARVGYRVDSSIPRSLGIAPFRCGLC